jgi:CBS domain-containing protein
LKAGEVMTTKVMTVRPNTSTRDIARLLLENHISAVPVLDGSGAPVGVVSKGDLIGRDDAAREARGWWLEMLAEGRSLSPDFLSSLRRPERNVSDIMSRPAVCVGEDTETSEIVRLLQSHRIKRVPVVRNGTLVGIISRENLLRALAMHEI